MKTPGASELILPKRQWRSATCEVCGQSFDYSGGRQPRVCRTGDCRYKHYYRIEPKTWASYQPTFFDQVDSEK